MLLILTGLSGCMSGNSNPASMIGAGGPRFSRTIPGVQGPWGAPVPMIGRNSSGPLTGAQLAQATIAAQGMPGGPGMPVVPPSGIVQAGYQGPAGSSGFVPAGGIPPMPTLPGAPPLPPGMVGPGGIVQAGHLQPHGPWVPNAVASAGAITSPHGPRFPTRRTEIRFVGPAGMKVSWPGPYGDRGNEIQAPGRYNFIQGGIYRLKLTELPGRPGLDLYPTLEVVPANLRTDAYIAHSAVPVYFTDEDIEQVLGGNYLVKVIYLPNPQYADVAMTGGPEEVVSTRLEPGADPIAEACKRGSILVIIRMGNIDLEAPNTPPMNAPNPYQCGPMGAAPMMMPAGPGMPMQPPPPGLAMQLPMPPVPGAPMMPVQMVPASVPEGQPANTHAPAVVPARTAPQAQPTGPVGRLPESTPVKPVRYEEPKTAPTPAQLAGQQTR
jgi:hypothetical protein